MAVQIPQSVPYQGSERCCRVSIAIDMPEGMPRIIKHRNPRLYNHHIAGGSIENTNRTSEQDCSLDGSCTKTNQLARWPSTL